MSQTIRGVAALVLCAIIWGLSPLFYALLIDVPALEVLAHRTLWSAVFFALILLAQRRLAEVGPLLRRGRDRRIVIFASVMIAFNWLGFILAIQTGRAIEASLGYYIFPLVAVLLGRIAFGERLGIAQSAAVALAAVAVVVLTIGLGVAPWVALGLAVTFGAYGLVKKTLAAGPVVSVFAEVIVVLPLALAYLLWAGIADRETAKMLLLMASGPMTAVPLMLFSYGARRVRLSTVGVLQYLNPTLQFLCATWVLGEVFTRWHAIAFPMIWAALILYSAVAIIQDRASRRAASRAGTSVTDVV